MASSEVNVLKWMLIAMSLAYILFEILHLAQSFLIFICNNVVKSPGRCLQIAAWFYIWDVNAVTFLLAMVSELVAYWWHYPQYNRIFYNLIYNNKDSDAHKDRNEDISRTNQDDEVVPTSPSDISQQMRSSNYRWEYMIGKGTFGEVFYSKHPETGEPVAIKVAEVILTGLSFTRDESDFLKRASNHPDPQYFLKWIDYIEEEKVFSDFKIGFRASIVTEFFEGVGLQNFGGMGYQLENLELIRRIFVQLTQALCYCHQLGIIHTDVKHENVLINYQNRIKLIDFGIAQDGPFSTRWRGTEDFMAPEVKNCYNEPNPRPYTYNTDFYSMGIILHILFFNEFPCDDMLYFFGEERQLEGAQVQIKVPYAVPSRVQLFLSDLLEQDPDKRLNDDIIWEHPFFSEERSS